MPMEREIQLLQSAYQAGVTSPKELANFMAQVNVESGHLEKLEESFCYTHGTAQIPSEYAHRHGDATLEAARIAAIKGHPEELAELMYGGRMGNNLPWDGYKYRGRGYIQLTGKDNYTAAGQALGLDLVHDPDMAAKPENAERIAVWIWQSQVPTSARDDVTKATLAINGGYNGLKERRTQFSEWERALTPDVMEQLKHGQQPELPAQLSGTHSIHRNSNKPLLHEGARNKAAKALQVELATLGYTDNQGHPLKADGDFGPATRLAVEHFQHDHQLTVDGKVGLRTQQALHAALKERDSALSLIDAHHPDHGLFEQALAGVRRLDGEQGRATDGHSLNLAAALTVEAKREGLHRIDQVILNNDASRTFAIQYPNSLIETRKVATVDTMTAVQTPMAQSASMAAAVPSVQPSLTGSVPAQQMPAKAHHIDH
ncbi:XVIPCD domain-containing protein [Dyella sp. A6]|uniref:XVIPCD domain-containing protein n=1 Tax=Dyella aluminiiresistens TaxID=3069105 RepID=UPI002E77101F|nr:XVIPCD domain-containing protein [Dyella sp. A6]